MNKEFRGWNNQKKEYCKNPIAVSNDGVLEMIEPDRWMDTSLIPEQFVGCKDLDGKKVYENDILEDEDGMNFIVKEVDFSWQLLNLRYDIEEELYEFIVDGDCVDLRVVGNIHQNQDIIGLYGKMGRSDLLG